MNLSSDKELCLLLNPSHSPLFLKIKPLSNLSSKIFNEYFDEMCKRLYPLLPFQLQAEQFPEQFIEWSQEALPLVECSEPVQLPDCFSLYLLCPPLTGVKTENFFLELMKHSLLPGKELSFLSFQHMTFYVQDVDKELFFFAEAKIFVENRHELDQIKQNLPFLRHEISSSLKTPDFAKHLLEHKVYSLDPQTRLVYRDLITIIQKQDENLGKNIFHEAHHFFLITNEQFRGNRHFRHLTRILFFFAYSRQTLARILSFPSGKRHLMLRFLPTHLCFTFSTQPVLGLIFTISLFDKYEFLEEEQILAAAQQLIPTIHVVKDSFHSDKTHHNLLLTIYIELEKNEGTKFSYRELALLKQSLPEKLKRCVEQLIPFNYRIRNEEEIIKNIRLLSQELKMSNDLPQVIISFEERSPTGLVFTVVLVRVLQPRDMPLENLLKSHNKDLHFTMERSEIIGYVRKKLPKEANVFRVEIPKDSNSLEIDHPMLNFYLPRQKVVSILNHTLGSIRDYNGGLIAKQRELFSQFRQGFDKAAEENPGLLENFFYSIYPLEQQATLPLSILTNLFEFFLKGIQELPERKSYLLKIHTENDAAYVVVSAHESSFKSDLEKTVSDLNFARESLTTTEVYFKGSLFIGYVLVSHDCCEKENFSLAIQKGMQEWLDRIRSMQILNLCCLNLPLSLDPRMAGDEISETTMRMLFDGLMRIGKDGKPECAIAKSVHISQDQKHYTFHLRTCFWSDGTEVTATDFAYSWQTMLSPQFPTPFAYFLYGIKNARAVKEGVVAVDQLGFKVIDEHTLCVDLEYPVPYFLELTASSFFFPVNHRIDRIRPNWSIQEDANYVCNGPFCLKKSVYAQALELVKNPHYWDHSSVLLDKITIVKTDPTSAYEMFKKNELDWLGTPLMYPWEYFLHEEMNESIIEGHFQWIHWYVFNIQRFPFNNLKIRCALSYAIHRQAIIEELGYEEGSPALTLLPLIHTQLLGKKEIRDGDVEKAQQLFDEGLKELNIGKEDFPILTILCGTTGIRKKIAQLIKQQWAQTLGIQCRIEICEWTQLFHKVVTGDFEISNISWRPRIKDPIYTLNAFKYLTNKINFPKWENKDYQKTLDRADQEVDIQKRKALLAEAETILMNEMPFTPIFHVEQHCMKKSYLKEVSCLENGSVDFKKSYIEKY